MNKRRRYQAKRVRAYRKAQHAFHNLQSPLDRRVEHTRLGTMTTWHRLRARMIYAYATMKKQRSILGV